MHVKVLIITPMNHIIVHKVSKMDVYARFGRNDREEKSVYNAATKFSNYRPVKFIEIEYLD